MKVCNQDEPILRENPDRFCMFPIKYRAVWEMYKKAEASFWTGKLLQQSDELQMQSAAWAQPAMRCSSDAAICCPAFLGPSGACTGHSTLFGLAHHR